MSELAKELSKIMTNDDLHNLKKTSIELEKFVMEILSPLKNTLSNDWRKAKNLLTKISHDQKRVDDAVTRSEGLIKQINSCMGVLK